MFLEKDKPYDRFYTFFPIKVPTTGAANVYTPDESKKINPTCTIDKPFLNKKYKNILHV